MAGTIPAAVVVSRVSDRCRNEVPGRAIEHTQRFGDGVLQALITVPLENDGVRSAATRPGATSMPRPASGFMTLEEHRSHRHVYGGHDPGVLRPGGLVQFLQWLLGYSRSRFDSSVGRGAGPWANGYPTVQAWKYAGPPMPQCFNLNRGEPEFAAVPYCGCAETIAAEQRVSFLSMGPTSCFLTPSLNQQGAVAEAHHQLIE